MQRSGTFKAPTSSDFGQIIRSGERYIDKTDIIRILWDDDGAFVKVITRPKSSGKSLTISMLRHFFLPYVNGSSTKNLFKNLAIDGHPLQGKMSVIFLDLSSLDLESFSNFQEFYKAFFKIISSLYKEHNYLLQGLSDYEVGKFTTLANEEKLPDRSSWEIERALRNLAEFIGRHNHKKGLEHSAPILLLDLCSIPGSGTDKTVTEMLEFLTRFFICNLKDASGVFDSAVCVCENSKIRGDDFKGWYRAFCGNIFPDNCMHYTARFDNRYGKYIGLTEQEIMPLVKESRMDMDERTRQLLLQMDTFSVAGEKLFYPRKVFDYINERCGKALSGQRYYTLFRQSLSMNTDISSLEMASSCFARKYSC